MPLIKQNADASAGIVGTDVTDGEFVFVSLPYSPTTPLAQSAAVFSRRMIVKAVYAVADVGATNAVTVSVYKTASGVAPASGALVHGGSINAQGTANTNQVMALTAANVDVPLGSRICVVVSGAIGAAGSGVVTVALAPA